MTDNVNQESRIGGWVELSVQNDSLGLVTRGEQIAVDVKTISTMTGLAEKGGTLVVVAEPAVTSAVPWVFRDPVDEQPRIRELIVAEEHEVVERLVSWARGDSEMFHILSQADWERWQRDSYTLNHDLKVGPPVRIVKKRKPDE